ncbi:hypothetical protein KPL78_12405 [Roseomonas sp. HJA6]|uniref:Uncharacterized protein n=1 Tax=Roseomonas alba TaxID=2846776 RepID=A0ABS7A8M7_9PROT|nr:hypothetical protein [Neoroseomonas alba]MBW6398658.1 hypothetical protein [Neoroseomonas alba]
MTSTTTAATLSRGTLALAVADCAMRGMDADATCAALPREDPEKVRVAHEAVSAAREGGFVEPGCRGVAERRMRRPSRRRSRLTTVPGLTLRDIAGATSIPRSTLKAAMIHHGYLAEVMCGGRQRRALVTEAAEREGIGHNVDASGKHSPRVSGFARSAVFAVFHADRMEDVLWTLDLKRIAEHCARLMDKRRRLEWLLRWHHYLPNDELAQLSGMSLRSVDAAAAKTRAADQRHEEAGGRGWDLFRRWAVTEMAENDGRLRRPSLLLGV